MLQTSPSSNLANAETNNEAQIFVSRQDALIGADIDRKSTTPSISLNISPMDNRVSSEVILDGQVYSREQRISIDGDINCDSSFTPHLSSTALNNPFPLSCIILSKRKLSFNVHCSRQRSWTTWTIPALRLHPAIMMLIIHPSKSGKTQPSQPACLLLHFIVVLYHHQSFLLPIAIAIVASEPLHVPKKNFVMLQRRQKNLFPQILPGRKNWEKKM